MWGGVILQTTNQEKQTNQDEALNPIREIVKDLPEPYKRIINIYKG